MGVARQIQSARGVALCCRLFAKDTLLALLVMDAADVEGQRVGHWRPVHKTQSVGNNNS